MNDDYVKRLDVHTAFQPKYSPAINHAFAAIIDSVPSADVVERKTGKWAKQQKDFDLCGVEYFACSQCGFECQLTYNFCPNCGAKMEVDDG